MIGQLVAALGTALQPVLAQLPGLLAPFLGQIVQLAPVVAQLATQIIATLAPALTQVGTALGQVLVAVTPVLAALGPIAGQLISALAPALTQISSALGQVLVAVAPLIQALGELIADILTPLMPILTPIISLLGTLASIIATVLAGVLTNLLIPALKMSPTCCAAISPARGTRSRPWSARSGQRSGRRSATWESGPVTALARRCRGSSRCPAARHRPPPLSGRGCGH